MEVLSKGLSIIGISLLGAAFAYFLAWGATWEYLLYDNMWILYVSIPLWFLMWIQQPMVMTFAIPAGGYVVPWAVWLVTYPFVLMFDGAVSGVIGTANWFAHFVQVPAFKILLGAIFVVALFKFLRTYKGGIYTNITFDQMRRWDFSDLKTNAQIKESKKADKDTELEQRMARMAQNNRPFKTRGELGITGVQK